MGTRSSRLQEESVCGSLEKDSAVKREAFRRIRSDRPSSLALDFSSSFDRDSETNQSRSEEGSDSDTSRHRVTPTAGDNNSTGRNVEPEIDNDDDTPGSPDRFSSEEAAAGVALRASAERLIGARRHSSSSSSRNSSARSARVRTARPVSEAWIGLYRVRHSIRCPFCTRMYPGGCIEEHLLTCLTSPALPYNTDVLSKDSGECCICLEELLQGDTIARLACLCVYHKNPVYPTYPQTAGYVPPAAQGVQGSEPVQEGGETPAFAVSAFDDKTVRRAFIRKVFSVVTVQLVVTFSIVCLFTFSKTLKNAVQKNIWIYLSSYIIFIIVYGTLGALLYALVSHRYEKSRDPLKDFTKIP
ncbi:E3 ubiquitin-protein ligase ZNRF2 [Bagarius yarrelli]|uniref:RING-type E3 ubiquitin transferase n=1 Tax=Bagarius yarrelli TaxID=175774 RepID=A0A556TZQ1_BAGYA|nr:E3 ubiquitin-protein ligase ZNRF2 [Bagarius yarrelli]